MSSVIVCSKVVIPIRAEDEYTMDKARLAAALSLLINSKSFLQKVRKIEEIIADWNETPLLFGGALEPLNALVDVGLTNRAALDKLVKLAESKRRAIPEAKRVDYQRNLMREKRERLYKAVKLEELVRGTPLKGAAKTKYMNETQARWMKERAAFIAQKGDLTWKQRNDAANEFWAHVDAQLEHDLVEAKQVLDKPPMKRKQVVKVEKPVPNTAMGKAFVQASSKKRTR